MMRTKISLVAAGLVAMALAFATHAPTVAAKSRTPVIVEMFTSEGCSSCPPADDVLSELEQSQPVPGVQIIALGEHVDYWNSLGWRDPYSTSAYSARQYGYGSTFHLDSVYTPQMVVDGHAQFVGSDRDRAVRAIADAARAPKADVHLSRGKGQDGTYSLSVTVDHLPPGTPSDTADVILVVIEDGLRDTVTHGENAGRTLAHSAVVRQMRVLGSIHANSVFAAAPHIAPAQGWNRDSLQAVVFVQERASHRVVGAAAIALR